MVNDDLVALVNRLNGFVDFDNFPKLEANWSRDIGIKTVTGGTVNVGRDDATAIRGLQTAQGVANFCQVTEKDQRTLIAGKVAELTKPFEKERREWCALWGRFAAEVWSQDTVDEFNRKCATEPLFMKKAFEEKRQEWCASRERFVAEFWPQEEIAHEFKRQCATDPFFMDTEVGKEKKRQEKKVEEKKEQCQSRVDEIAKHVSSIKYGNASRLSALAVLSSLTTTIPVLFDTGKGGAREKIDLQHFKEKLIFSEGRNNTFCGLVESHYAAHQEALVVLRRTIRRLIPARTSVTLPVVKAEWGLFYDSISDEEFKTKLLGTGIHAASAGDAKRRLWGIRDPVKRRQILKKVEEMAIFRKYIEQSSEEEKHLLRSRTEMHGKTDVVLVETYATLQARDKENVDQFIRDQVAQECKHEVKALGDGKKTKVNSKIRPLKVEEIYERWHVSGKSTKSGGTQPTIHDGGAPSQAAKPQINTSATLKQAYGSPKKKGGNTLQQAYGSRALVTKKKRGKTLQQAYGSRALVTKKKGGNT